MYIERCNFCMKIDICPIKEELNELFEHLETHFCEMVTEKDINIKLGCRHFVPALGENEENENKKTKKKKEKNYE